MALACAAPRPQSGRGAKASSALLMQLWQRYAELELRSVPDGPQVEVAPSDEGLLIRSTQSPERTVQYELKLEPGETAGPIRELAQDHYKRDFPAGCLSSMLSAEPYANQDPPPPCSLETGLGILRSLFIGDRNLHRYLARDEELSTGPQRRAIQALEDATLSITTSQQPSLQIAMPAGTGKTHVLTEFLKRYCASGSALRAHVAAQHGRGGAVAPCRILVLSQRAALLPQMRRRIVEALPAPGEQTASDKDTIIIPAGTILVSEDFEGYRVALLTGQKAASLRRDPVTLFYDVIVVDESHRADTNRFLTGLKSFPNYGMRIGLSATPKAPSNTNPFRQVTYRQSYKQAIDQGYLTPVRIAQIVSNLGTEAQRSAEAGPYGERLGHLARRLLRGDLQARPWASAANPHALAITTTEAAGVRCVATFNQPEVSGAPIAKALYSNKAPPDPNAELLRVEEILEDFRQGNFELLVTAQKANEGVDLPNLNTLMLTKEFHGSGEAGKNSTRLLIQRLGRCQRVDVDKRWCDALSFWPIAQGIESAAAYLETADAYGVGGGDTPSSVELEDDSRGTPFGKLAGTFDLRALEAQ